MSNPESDLAQQLLVVLSLGRESRKSRVQAIAEQGHSLGLTLRYLCEEVKAEEVEVEYEVKVEFEDDF